MAEFVNNFAAANVHDLDSRIHAIRQNLGTVQGMELYGRNSTSVHIFIEFIFILVTEKEKRKKRLPCIGISDVRKIISLLGIYYRPARKNTYSQSRHFFARFLHPRIEAHHLYGQILPCTNHLQRRSNSRSN